MRSPFTLYKESTKNGGFVWYARFWDVETEKYSVARSTGIIVAGKRERKHEAEEVARSMLPSITFTKRNRPKLADKPFLQYVADFWTAESPYVKECAIVRKKPLSAYYISMHHDDVRRHMAAFPGFKGLSLKNLNRAIYAIG